MLSGCNAAKWITGCNNITFEDGTQSKACYRVPEMHRPVGSGACANWDYCPNSEECSGNIIILQINLELCI